MEAVGESQGLEDDAVDGHFVRVLVGVRVLQLLISGGWRGNVCGVEHAYADWEVRPSATL